MAAFPDISLGSAKMEIGLMILSEKSLVTFVCEVMVLPVFTAVHKRSVIARVDDQGVVSGSGLVEGLQNFTNGVVDLMHKVTVGTELGFPDETLVGPYGFVGSGEREVEKKGFAIFALTS